MERHEWKALDGKELFVEMHDWNTTRSEQAREILRLAARVRELEGERDKLQSVLELANKTSERRGAERDALRSERVKSVREVQEEMGRPFVESGEVERSTRPGYPDDVLPIAVADSAQVPGDSARQPAESSAREWRLATEVCKCRSCGHVHPSDYEACHLCNCRYFFSGPDPIRAEARTVLASPEAPASEKAKRVYLCARYSRHPEMQGVAAQLRALGYEVTSRWIEGNHDVSDLNGGSGEHFAQEDWDDLRAASILIAFTEGPKPNGRNRGGRHVEFGAALALGQRVIVIGPRENVFHHLPEVEVFDDMSSCLASLAVSR